MLREVGAKIRAGVLIDEVTFADGDGGCGLLCETSSKDLSKRY